MPFRRQRAFTLVELLIAISLSAVVALVLIGISYQLIRATDAQTRRFNGPYAAQQALAALSVDLACAFAPPPLPAATNAAVPPEPQTPPFQLETPTNPTEPIRLSFIAPEPNAADHPLYALRRVAYEFRWTAPDRYDWLLISAPTAGPYTNAPATNLLYRGPLHPAFQALPPPPTDPDIAYDPTPLDAWPPAGRVMAAAGTNAPPALPAAVVATLYDGPAPVSSATYPIQCAIPIPPAPRHAP